VPSRCSCLLLRAAQGRKREDHLAGAACEAAPIGAAGGAEHCRSSPRSTTKLDLHVIAAHEEDMKHEEDMAGLPGHVCVESLEA
jgi:hypothetical protein